MSRDLAGDYAVTGEQIVEEAFKKPASRRLLMPRQFRDRGGMQANIEQAMFYFDLVAKRRAEPQDDLFTKLVQAELERENGEMDRLDDIEIAAFASLLGGAGAETVTKLVGNAVYMFAKHQDQWQEMGEDRSKISGAVEELLRYEAPSQYNVRRNMRAAL